MAWHTRFTPYAEKLFQTFRNYNLWPSYVVSKYEMCIHSFSCFFSPRKSELTGAKCGRLPYMPTQLFLGDHVTKLCCSRDWFFPFSGEWFIYLVFITELKDGPTTKSQGISTDVSEQGSNHNLTDAPSERYSSLH